MWHHRTNSFWTLEPRADVMKGLRWVGNNPSVMLERGTFHAQQNVPTCSFRGSQIAPGRCLAPATQPPCEGSRHLRKSAQQLTHGTQGLRRWQPVQTPQIHVLLSLIVPRAAPWMECRLTALRAAGVVESFTDGLMDFAVPSVRPSKASAPLHHYHRAKRTSEFNTIGACRVRMVKCLQGVLTRRVATRDAQIQQL